MGFDAYTIDDNGVTDDPVSRDWARWVSASRTRNRCLNNALQDWLERYGEAAGFIRDPAADERTDFVQFIFAKGRQFETEVVKLLHERVGVTAIRLQRLVNPVFRRLPPVADSLKSRLSYSDRHLR